MRHSGGTATVSGVSEEGTLEDLRSALFQALGRSPCPVEIKFGFPPRPIGLECPGTEKLKELGIKDGETLQVVLVECGPVPAKSEPPAPPPTNPTHSQRSAPASASSGFAQAASVSGGGGVDSLGVSLPDGNVLVKRVIESDNSCLFNSVGYVMERDKHRSQSLRQIVASTVASDPSTYNEVFLEKKNSDYCEWILDSQRWGGAIELSILSKHYRREISAFDIQTKRCDVYGSGCGYAERAMVVYDGLHYDALALSPFEGAPEDFDITLLDTSSHMCLQATEVSKRPPSLLPAPPPHSPLLPLQGSHSGH